MIKYFLTILVILGLAWVLWPLVAEFYTQTGINSLAASYVYGSAADLHVPNVVTAVVVTYRGLDTLGEVTVLFLATAGVAFFLKRGKSPVTKKRPGSEILQTGASFLAPLIIMFGVYIFVHGHLTPGGGFQGGVVVASAVLLLLMAFNNFKFAHGVMHVAESLSGATYVALGLAGLLLLGANNFLDPRWLGLGQWGKLFSAGAVPVIYSLIGIKVGAELASVLDSIQHDGGKA